MSGDFVVSGDRGAESEGGEFPEDPALAPEVIVGPQPGALGFRADAPDVSGAVGKNPEHSIARMARYSFADAEAMML